MDIKEYDALIMVTPKDFTRVESQYKRMLNLLPVRRLIFVGNSQVGELVEEYKKKAGLPTELETRVGFVNEDAILPFDEVHAVMKDELKNVVEGELPRGITGWYYQQFLKMKYADSCEDEYYMVWDGDTIPCGEFSMFKAGTDKPYLDVKSEYHEEYFVTLSKLFPEMHKCIKGSFISEHMLMNTDIMKELMKAIEQNTNLRGTSFWEKVIRCIGSDKLRENSFSEFETYGTFVAFRHLNKYMLRDWHSFRYGGEFYEMDKIDDEDFRWLAKDFFAISFEKNHFVREDHRNLFDNKEYQAKLSARQMLEIAQEEFKDGMLEVW